MCSLQRAHATNITPQAHARKGCSARSSINATAALEHTHTPRAQKARPRNQRSSSASRKDSPFGRLPLPHTQPPPPPEGLSEASTLVSPVKASELARWLDGYSQVEVDKLVLGFKEGFRIGYTGHVQPSQPANLKSALDHPIVVDQKIEKEVSLGRFAGPFRSAPFTPFQISPVGVVPKKETGKFRLIHHLSYPKGHSINDGIPTEQSHVTYQTVDDATQAMKALGKGCYLAKTDIADAYRIVPLHPTEYHLFGIKWRGQYYYDRCLPMGCSASCQIFKTLSVALHWVANAKLGIRYMAHILDDFLILDSSKKACSDNLQSFVDMCSETGIPISQEKTFPPSQKLVFLGYELDSVEMAIRLPQDKVQKCRDHIQDCLKKDKIKLKDLQALTGLLNFACGAVVPGRAFLRRLYNLSIGVKQWFHYIRITKQVREDLIMWQEFLSSYNGKSLLLPDRWTTSPSINLFTDASGTLGYGAVFGSQWFFGPWNDEWRGQSIELLEFYPICLAIEIWGPVLGDKCISFYTDNQGLVSVINTQTSRSPQVMFLMRRLVLMCLRYNILFQARHVSGVDNNLADALSRLQVDAFRAAAPWARRSPTPVPPLPALPH